jgi:hypothetical protein
MSAVDPGCVYNRTRNFGLYGHAESKKNSKIFLPSALRANQISFSHGQDPLRTSALAVREIQIIG